MLLQLYFKDPKVETTQIFIKKINEKQVWHLHTREYYSALKDEMLIHTIIWINLKNMLSEISQTQSDRQCIIPLI